MMVLERCVSDEKATATATAKRVAKKELFMRNCVSICSSRPALVFRSSSLLTLW